MVLLRWRKIPMKIKPLSVPLALIAIVLAVMPSSFGQSATAPAPTTKPADELRALVENLNITGVTDRKGITVDKLFVAVGETVDSGKGVVLKSIERAASVAGRPLRYIVWFEDKNGARASRRLPPAGVPGGW